MSDVTIRELRNHSGDVVARAARGETITITKASERVAELRPLPRPGPSAESLIARWRRLPSADPTALRSDLDELLDATL